jgi:hypothetical protein
MSGASTENSVLFDKVAKLNSDATHVKNLQSFHRQTDSDFSREIHEVQNGTTLALTGSTPALIEFQAGESYEGWSDCGVVTNTDIHIGWRSGRTSASIDGFQTKTDRFVR